MLLKTLQKCPWWLWRLYVSYDKLFVCLFDYSVYLLAWLGGWYYYIVPAGLEIIYVYNLPGWASSMWQSSCLILLSWIWYGTTIPKCLTRSNLRGQWLVWACSLKWIQLYGKVCKGWWQKCQTPGHTNPVRKQREHNKMGPDYQTPRPTPTKILFPQGSASFQKRTSW